MTMPSRTIRASEFRTIFPFVTYAPAIVPTPETLNVCRDVYKRQLQLRLAWSPGSDSAAKARERNSLADQAWKPVFLLCQLDLQTSFPGAGAGSENIKNQRRSVCLLYTSFEGNFFNLTRHMHIPGIDMLFTKPESVLRFAETPKLLSSVAAWYGREHVMSEISGHTENALRIPFDINDMICAQLIQFVLGVDIFNSYFDDGSLTQEENRLLCDTVARACKEFAGKTSMADVILYYPIESAQASVKGSDQQLYERPFDADAAACEESWRGSIDLLLRHHYMFDCADETVLAGADISQEECCVRNPASGIRYHALVVPRLAAVTRSALELFQKCADCGIRCV